MFFLSGFLTDFLWRRVGISHRFFLISHRFHGFHRFFAAVGGFLTDFTDFTDFFAVCGGDFSRISQIFFGFLTDFTDFFAVCGGDFSQISRILQIFFAAVIGG